MDFLFGIFVFLEHSSTSSLPFSTFSRGGSSHDLTEVRGHIKKGHSPARCCPPFPQGLLLPTEFSLFDFHSRHGVFFELLLFSHHASCLFSTSRSLLCHNLFRSIRELLSQTAHEFASLQSSLLSIKLFLSPLLHGDVISSVLYLRDLRRFVGSQVPILGLRFHFRSFCLLAIILHRGHKLTRSQGMSILQACCYLFCLFGIVPLQELVHLILQPLIDWF
mmetsp:Transcript_9423/g.19589  ORF Transcript_9423/g.19589 Transcript_9423/m.19589 type:complete len:220 (-) Transcript_9423:463-1122(-)